MDEKGRGALTQIESRNCPQQQKEQEQAAFHVPTVVLRQTHSSTFPPGVFPCVCTAPGTQWRSRVCSTGRLKGKVESFLVSQQTDPELEDQGKNKGCELKSLFLRACHCSLGQHSAQTGSSAGTGVLTFRARVRHTGEEGGGQGSLRCTGPESPLVPI